MTGGDTGPRETDRHGMMEAEPGAEAGRGGRIPPGASSGAWSFPSVSGLLAFGMGRIGGGHVHAASIPQWVDLSVAAPGYPCRKEAWRLLSWSPWETKGVAQAQMAGQKMGTRRFPLGNPACHLGAT